MTSAMATNMTNAVDSAEKYYVLSHYAESCYTKGLESYLWLMLYLAIFPTLRLELRLELKLELRLELRLG